MIYPGFEIWPTVKPLGFIYGMCVYGPTPEERHLDDIRPCLMDPNCEGPDVVYSIAMDIGLVNHRKLLNEMHLLYGSVNYEKGKLGREPVRSQGHIHAPSPFNGWSTPEVYEIWGGEAIVYMQESADDNPGRCFAVRAKRFDVVVVPPGWVHATINADPTQTMAFGAWCAREYGFEYDGVRRHNGIAWFPVFNDKNEIEWLPNPAYKTSELIQKTPNQHEALGINPNWTIYSNFEHNPETFRFVPEPALKAEVWENFVP